MTQSRDFCAPMHILVINSGSSSIKFSIFAAAAGGPRSMFEGEVHGIGSGDAGVKFRDAEGRDLTRGESKVKADNPLEAMEHVLKLLSGPYMPPTRSVGHRVVHPG